MPSLPVSGTGSATRWQICRAGRGDPFAAARRRYIAGESLEAVPTLQELPDLGLPVRTRQTLASLIVRHAPQLDIATASDADRPGALLWQRDSDGRLRIGVALDQPVLYVRTSHAHFSGRWLLQLIYTAWFAARPPAHAYDVLAGRLDGCCGESPWPRDGNPLVYDTIHPCGCYHLFIPTEHVRARPQPESIDEGLFSPQTLRAPATHERVVLKLAAARTICSGSKSTPRARTSASSSRCATTTSCARCPCRMRHAQRLRCRMG
jgi:hypothetical protein